MSESSIARAEAALGVTFPAEYRDFLKAFGAVLLPGCEIYGLPPAAVSEPPLWNDVVKVTKALREQGQVGAELACYVPISDDGEGIYYFLDTRPTTNAPVIAIGPGVRRASADDLYSFAAALVAERG